MVFTTNKHPKRWGDVLHDDDLAEDGVAAGVEPSSLDQKPHW